MSKKTAMILGKFLPFHKGHEYLIDFARRYPDVDRLYVVIDRIADEPIPQSIRAKWIQETFPDIKVIPLGDLNYQDPSEAPDEQIFWDQWEKSLKNAVPEKVDYVFNSETYGWKLAEVLGATHIPVDRGRDNFPISGTEVRANPLAAWKYLPDAVRPYFLKKVAIVGAESTGKSTLAKKLADEFNTVVVPEYARVFLESLAEKDQPRSMQYEDLKIFARGQKASEISLAKLADRILICDTEAITTAVWSQTLYPEKPVDQAVRDLIDETNYDLYIVASPDVEWKPDIHRQWEDESKQHRRLAFHHHLIAELEAREKKYIIIGGKDYGKRFKQAKKIIQKMFSI